MESYQESTEALARANALRVWPYAIRRDLNLRSTVMERERRRIQRARGQDGDQAEDNDEEEENVDDRPSVEFLPPASGEDLEMTDAQREAMGIVAADLAAVEKEAAAVAAEMEVLSSSFLRRL